MAVNARGSILQHVGREAGQRNADTLLGQANFQFLSPPGQFAADRGAVLEILKQGTERARNTAAATLSEVKGALGLNYFD